ncbi:MAG: hypothetical protein LBH35_07120, partial [Treponema sp.]|nr:hypothetical protein [Treponema sp.]
MNLPAAETDAVLCADIGTSSLKAALIGVDGKPAAFSRISYAGAAPGCWLAAFLGALESLAAQCPARRAKVLVISGNGPTLVPVAGDGRPLEPVQWFSPSKSGPFYGPSLFLPKLAAYRERDPERFITAKLFLSSQEWLSYTLGADPVTVLAREAYRPFYWDEEQCEKAGLDMGIFPPFAPMGSRIGRVTAAGRIRPPDVLAGAEKPGGKSLPVGSALPAETLLPEGTPILAGGPDFIMALIGTSVLEPGMICDRAGSSEGINLCVDADTFDGLKNSSAAEGIRLLPHPENGFYNAGVVIGESGSLFEAYR